MKERKGDGDALSQGVPMLRQEASDTKSVVHGKILMDYVTPRAFA